MKLKFADSIFICDYNGSVFKGQRDSVFAQIKNYRKAMPVMKPDVRVHVALKSLDKNQNWCVAWFKEVRGDSKGKLDSVYMVENWRFNNQGKV